MDERAHRPESLSGEALEHKDGEGPNLPLPCDAATQPEEAERLRALEHPVEPHVILLSARELAEPRGDALEPGLFGGDEPALVLHPDAQHLGDRVRVTGLQELCDLIEGESAVLERQDARQIT